MKSRLVNEVGGQRTFVIVLDPGEEAFATLIGFATEQGVGGASLTDHRRIRKSHRRLVRPRCENLPQNPGSRTVRGAECDRRCCAGG